MAQPFPQGFSWPPLAPLGAPGRRPCREAAGKPLPRFRRTGGELPQSGKRSPPGGCRRKRIKPIGAAYRRRIAAKRQERPTWGALPPTNEAGRGCGEKHTEQPRAMAVGPGLPHTPVAGRKPIKNWKAVPPTSRALSAAARAGLPHTPVAGHERLRSRKAVPRTSRALSAAARAGLPHTPVAGHERLRSRKAVPRTSRALRTGRAAGKAGCGPRTFKKQEGWASNKPRA